MTRNTRLYAVELSCATFWETVIRNVGELKNSERLVYERVLGHPLAENQQVVIQVVTAGVQPTVEQRRGGLVRLRQLTAQGVTEQEADRTIDEAIRHVHDGES